MPVGETRWRFGEERIGSLAKVAGERRKEKKGERKRKMRRRWRWLIRW